MTEREFWQAAWVASRSAGCMVPSEDADWAVRELRARVKPTCGACGTTVVPKELQPCGKGGYCVVNAGEPMHLPDETMSNMPSLPTREQIRAAMDGAAFCAHCGGNHAKGAPHVL